MLVRLTASRPRLRRACLVAVAVSALVATADHGAAASAQSREELDQLRQLEFELAANVDVLNADVEEVSAALTTMGEHVALQQARVDDSRRAAEASRAQHAQAEADRRQAEERIAVLRAQLQEVAVSAYVRPPSDDLAQVLADDDPAAPVKRRVFAAAGTGITTDVIDQLGAAKEQSRIAGRVAAEAVARAEAAEAAETVHLGELQHALGAQLSFVDGVQDRLDHTLSEAVSVSARSQALAEEITAREQRLATAAARSTGSPSDGRPSWVSSGVSVTTVRGIEVSTAIADQLEDLLAAAEADGVYLTGSGYRDTSTQITLREAHCGSSEYAIWDMPSGDCSPPVARPGRSMHEQGLAVDFVVGDDLIRSRSTTAFRWLSNNAGDYGFYNLPSEPWHWSTNGR